VAPVAEGTEGAPVEGEEAPTEETNEASE